MRRSMRSTGRNRQSRLDFLVAPVPSAQDKRVRQILGGKANDDGDHDDEMMMMMTSPTMNQPASIPGAAPKKDNLVQIQFNPLIALITFLKYANVSE